MTKREKEMRENLEEKKRILKRRITKEKEQNVIASMKVKKEQLRKYEKEGKKVICDNFDDGKRNI